MNPDIWLLIPRFDSNGLRFHTLVHVFICHANHFSNKAIRTAENEGRIIAYIRKKIPNIREREEIFIEEIDLLRFVVLKEAGKELLEELQVEGTIQ